jgi:putative aldouronate transport system substrate-binding protein
MRTRRRILLVMVISMGFTVLQLSAADFSGKGFRFDQTLTFSYLVLQNPSYVESTPIIDEIQKRLNCKINLIWTPTANFNEKLTGIIASGDIPDCIAGADYNIMLKQGAALPLDDLLAKYGQSITRFYEPDDYVYLRNADDGKIYRLMPYFDFPQSYSIVIRTDWLDQYKLAVPETLDDWIKVLTKFRDEDANGDGDRTNEVPWVTGVGGMLPFMNAYGIKPSGGIGLTAGGGFFCLTADKKFVPYFEHPNYKAYLTMMAKMYREGLLDREFASRLGNMNEQYKVIDANLGGAGFVYNDKPNGTTVALRKNNPKARLAPTKPIKGPYGDQWQLGRAKFSTSAITYLTVAAEKNKKAEKIMQFWNWMFSDEGIKLINFGIEGMHHDLVNGKPILRPEYNKDLLVYRKSGMGYAPFTINWTEEAFMQVLLKGKSPDQISETDRLQYDALYINKPFLYQSLPTFTTKTVIAKGTDLFAQLQKQEASAIAGQISVDQFFVEYDKIKKAGFDQIIKENQEAYQKTAK